MSNLRTIKIRGDSTENWELANPILEYKEMACEFADNGTFFKIGNGIDSWNDLAYVSTVIDIDITDAEVKQKYENNPDTNAFTDDDKSKLSGAAQKSANLSDLEDAATARQNLGLGTAATKDVGTDSNNVMEVGAFGLGSTGSGSTIDVSSATPNGIYTFNSNSTGLPPQVDPNGAVGLIFNWGKVHQWGLFGKVQNNRVFLRRYVGTQNDNDVVELHTTGNILTTTGQSTQFPMTQKAVTDALGTKVNSNDTRLSDAREWTASVVPQAEAEGGTSTTARKWTSQRVRQAIVAWWNTIGTAFGKTLLGSANAEDARTTLGLGTVIDDLDSKVDKVQTKEIVTANKTLTAADRGKLLIINSDGITITMPANSNFTIDIAKMDESFTTVVQCVGTDKFREDSTTISVIRDVSITNSGIAGKEWLAIGAYEV